MGRFRINDNPALRRWRRAVARGAAGLALSALAVAGASGAAAAAPGYGGYHDPDLFGIESFTTASSDMSAGGHPDVSTSFRLRNAPGGGRPLPFGRVARVEVDMPAGLVGNPTSFPTCSLREFHAFDARLGCRADTQVGVARVEAVDASFGGDTAIYNLERGPDEPVLLGLKVDITLYSFIRVQVRPDGGLTAVVDEIPLAHPVVGTDLTLWGVPADHNRSGAPRVPFMTGPTECETIPTTTMRAYSYEGRVATATHSLAHPPEDCGAVPFRPAMTAVPTDRRAAAPTGLDVEIKVPQNALPDGRTAAHVDQVRIALPNGMTVSPSSAGGLAACAPAQFGYRTDSPISCPAASKIGSLSIDTPLLEEPMSGSVYLARQNDNPFGSLLALYLVAEGTGVTIKLAGRVDPDPVTGRLTTTFRGNPQLPFSRLRLRLKSGPRAPLTNPRVCGTYASETTITSWAGHTVSATTPMSVDQDCEPPGFTPSFAAGMVDAVGGGSSTFSLTFGRDDHDEELRDITVQLPRGITGKLADIVQCWDQPASAGTCKEQSRVGTVTTGAGPGTNPFYLPGRVYLTRGYKGAPFGLSIVVPAVAGPFDLGTVVVRAGIYVDRETAALRVISDPMPRILQGIPLQVRTVNVAMDRPDFMLAPTSCDEKRIGAVVRSQAGTEAAVGSRFQVGDCARLSLRQRMTFVVGRKGRTRRDSTTPLTATLRQPAGQSNLSKVRVTLPTTLNSRVEVVNNRNACTPEQFEQARCPRTIGNAVAVTPLLRDPLRGNVYLVRTPERSLPDMYVQLRGQGRSAGVEIVLRGKITITRKRLALRTTFDAVPDVPIRMFSLRLTAGENAAVGVVTNLCTRKARRARAGVVFVGQNGKREAVKQRLRIRGCSRKAKQAARKRALKRAAQKRAASRKAASRRARN